MLAFPITAAWLLLRRVYDPLLMLLTCGGGGDDDLSSLFGLDGLRRSDTRSPTAAAAAATDVATS